MRAETVQPQEEDVYGGSHQCIQIPELGVLRGESLALFKVPNNSTRSSGRKWYAQVSSEHQKSVHVDLTCPFSEISRIHLDMVLGSLL